VDTRKEREPHWRLDVELEGILDVEERKVLIGAYRHNCGYLTME